MDAKKYTFVVQWSDEDDGFICRPLEFRGFSAIAESASEAISECIEALQVGIDMMAEAGDPIPEPLSRKKYSGKMMVRLPSSLHAELAERAAIEGVSLNQHLAVRLAAAK